MFLRIAGVRSTEQSGIKGVKIPFDPNIIFIVVALRLFNKIDVFLQKHAKVFDLYLEMDNGKSIGLFLQEMRKKQIRAEAIETTKTKVPGNFSSIVVTMWVEHYNMRAELIDEIRNLDYVHYVEEM